MKSEGNIIKIRIGKWSLFVVMVLVFSFGLLVNTSAAAVKGYSIPNKKVALYTKSNLKKRSAWISPSTELRITTIKAKYVKVSCRQNKKNLTGFIKNEDVVDGMVYDRKYASDKIKVYRKFNGKGKYGTISRGGEVFVIGSRNNYTHVIYRSGKEFRLGWIREKALVSTLLTYSQAQDASLNVKTLGSVSLFKGMTALVGKVSTHESNVKNLKGPYLISLYNSKLCLDIHRGSLSNEGNLEVCNPLFQENQLFRFHYLNNGFYSIQCVYSDLYLDLNMETGNVTQYEWNGGYNQQWGVTKIASKIFIYNRYNDCYLDNSNGRAVSGNNVIAYPFTGEENQIWKLTKFYKSIDYGVAQGTYTFLSKQDNSFVVDVYAPQLKVYLGSNVQLCRRNNGFNQKFVVKHVTNGYCRITIAGGPFCLGVETSGDTWNNIQVVKEIATDDGSAAYRAQLWRFVPADNGYFGIRSMYNGCYFDNTEGVLKDENNILSYHLNYPISDNQLWKPEKAG